MKIKTFVITGIIALGASFSLATTANADTHTVKSGESLWSIGEAYGETPEQLVAENAGKLSSINSVIFPGDSLEVGDYSTTSSTKYYTNSNATNYSQPTVSTSSNQSGSNSTSNTADSSSSVAYQAAQLMASKTGVSASEWSKIIEGESTGKTTASNSSSSAYGLFQVLGETSSDWKTQVNDAASLYKSQGLGAWSATR